MYSLYDWFIEEENGYMYCVGYLNNGKLWQTSSVDRIHNTPQGYRVVTKNSIYLLKY